jgi:hypothetical protein
LGSRALAVGDAEQADIEIKSRDLLGAGEGAFAYGQGECKIGSLEPLKPAFAFAPPPPILAP